jgi:hypothetical protein
MWRQLETRQEWLGNREPSGRATRDDRCQVGGEAIGFSGLGTAGGRTAAGPCLRIYTVLRRRHTGRRLLEARVAWDFRPRSVRPAPSPSARGQPRRHNPCRTTLPVWERQFRPKLCRWLDFKATSGLDCRPRWFGIGRHINRPARNSYVQRRSPSGIGGRPTRRPTHLPQVAPPRAAPGRRTG